MIRLNHPIFPHLVRQDEVSFKSWSDSNKTTTIYKIDWEKLDQYKYQRFVEDAEKNSMPDSYQFPGTLPEPYDSWVKNLEFAIPVNYLEEIRYNARMAQMIYCSSHPFDTMIREICYEPAVAHVYVAFRLIADCVYSRKDNYFYRGDEKIIVPQALLYKFWIHQTGSGLIKEHSHFDRITWMLEDKPSESNDSKTREVQKFIEAIKDFHKKLDKLHEVRCADIVSDNTGPSLGDTDKSLYVHNNSVTITANDNGESAFSVEDSSGNVLFEVKNPRTEKK